MADKTASAEFDFTIYITGLVLWRPIHAREGTFLGVRTPHPSDMGHGGGDLTHVAAFTYETRGLSGLGKRRTAAPDPLVVAPNGALFARRILQDEILWLEPDFCGEPQPLSADVPDLLELRVLDQNVTGVREDCMGSLLENTPAVSRLDVDAGRLTVHKSLKAGPWRIGGPRDRGSGGGGSPEAEIDSIATMLRLDLTGLRSLTVHSNKKPALRFAGEGHHVGSYTVEPVRDAVPPMEDVFPHFEMFYNLATWENSLAPPGFRKPYLAPDSKLTLSDRACPPVKGP